MEGTGRSHRPTIAVMASTDGTPSQSSAAFCTDITLFPDLSRSFLRSFLSQVNGSDSAPLS